MPESEFDSSGSFEREQEAARRERALQFLIESGRAKTPEEATEYLDSIIRLKEKLMILAQEIAREQQDDHKRNELRAYASYPMVRYGRRMAYKQDLEKLTVSNLNRTDPQVWKLIRFVDTDWMPAVGKGEELTIATRIGPPPDIVPDDHGRVERRIQKYLSREELELLRREYAFALKDLAKTLREAADATESDPPGWGIRELIAERGKAQ